MKLVKKSSFLLLILSFLSLLCLSSCRMKAEQKSLTNRLEIIDSLILQNQKKQAVKELKKLQKKAVDSWSYLGIYRRYVQLSESSAAEKLIKKALSKHSSNPELLAVYSKYLIGKQSFDEAEKYAQKLKGTKYGSIFSELALRKADSPENVREKFDFFRQDQYFSVFFDAYTGSHNSIWLKNCAVNLLCKGDFKAAAALKPEAYSDADDAARGASPHTTSGRDGLLPGGSPLSPHHSVRYRLQLSVQLSRQHAAGDGGQQVSADFSCRQCGTEHRRRSAVCCLLSHGRARRGTQHGCL